MGTEQRLQKAVKILGEHRRAEIEAAILGRDSFFRQLGLIQQQALKQRIRSQGAKQLKLLAKQYSAALRNVMGLTERGQRYLRIPLSVEFMEQLRFRIAICDIWEKGKSAPKPNADDKRLATSMALRLLKKETPTTTKTGTFCRLAAVLYGDESADLQHHCRMVLRSKDSMRSVKQSPAQRENPTATQHGDSGTGVEIAEPRHGPEQEAPSVDVETLSEAQN